MTTLQVVAWAWFGCVATALVHANRDALAPTKVFLLFVGVSYGGSLVSSTSSVVYFVVLSLATLLLFCSRLETSADVVANKLPIQPGRFEWKVWLLATPSVIATLGMVQASGGLSAYMEVLDERVVRLEGQGALLVAVKAMTAFQSAYFALLLARNRTAKTQWLLFALFTCIAAASALITGSRNTLLVMFLVMALCWSIRFGSGVSLKTGAIGVVVGIATLLLLGELRNQVDRLAGGEAASVTTSWSETKSIRYGVTPLERVSQTEYSPLLYGRTFAAAVTNFVPRGIWPEKPDGGGEEYTNYYFGSLWGGTSRESPGIFVESIMNFGWAWGLAFAYAVLTISVVGLCRVYATLKGSEDFRPPLILLYAYGVVFVGNLPFAEFATAAMNFVTRGCLAALAAWFLAKRLVWRR